MIAEIVNKIKMEQTNLGEMVKDYQRVFFDTNLLYVGENFWRDYVEKTRNMADHFFFSKLYPSEMNSLAANYHQLELFFEENKGKVKLASCLNEEFERYIKKRKGVIEEREEEYLFAKLSFRPGEEVARADVNCEGIIQIKAVLDNLDKIKTEITYEPDSNILKITKNYVSTLSKLPLELVVRSKDKLFTPGRATDEELVETVLTDVLKNKTPACLISNDKYVQRLLSNCFYFLTKANILCKYYLGSGDNGLVLDIFEKEEERDKIKLVKLGDLTTNLFDEEPQRRNELVISIKNILIETYKKIKEIEGKGPSNQ